MLRSEIRKRVIWQSGFHGVGYHSCRGSRASRTRSCCLAGRLYDFRCLSGGVLGLALALDHRHGLQGIHLYLQGVLDELGHCFCPGWIQKFT